MDFVCTHPDCNEECRISRKTSTAPSHCPYSGQERPFRRFIHMYKQFVTYRNNIDVHKADEIPSGWVLLKALEGTETVYKAIYFEHLTADKWKLKQDKWHKDNNVTIVSWVKITDVF